MSARNSHISAIVHLFEILPSLQNLSALERFDAQQLLLSVLKKKPDLNHWTRNYDVLKSSQTAQAVVSAFLTKYPPFETVVLLHIWLLALIADNCSPATIKNYRSDIRQFIEFHQEVSVSQLLQKPKVLTFLKEQSSRQSKSTVTRKLSSIAQFALFAQQQGWESGVQVWLTPLMQHSSLVIDQLQSLPNSTSQSSLSQKVLKFLSNRSRKTDFPGYWQLPLDLDTRPNQSHTPSAIHFQDSRSQLQSKLLNLSKQFSQSGRRQWMPWVNLGFVLLLLLGIGFFGYRQFIQDSSPSLAYPNVLTRPNRAFSFQGRLTDTAQNPIVSPTNMRFKLYDTGPGTGGTLLWDSNTCSIDPDQDGIFSTNLGSDCGSEITNDVFTEHSNVWLEVTVVSETLTPRQAIKSVAYALNSETLQGYPASASATQNTVPVLNNNGEMVLGYATPVIKSTGTLFTLEAQSMLIKTTSGSNGNIVLDPDGLGDVKILSNLDAQAAATVSGHVLIKGTTTLQNYLSAPGATLSATYAGGTALVLKAGPTATADIMQWQNSGGTPIGIIDKSGNVGIGTTTASQPLDVVGNAEIGNYLYFANGATNYLRFDGSDFLLSNDFLPSANNTYTLGTNSSRWSAIYGTAIYQGANQVCDMSGNCSSVGNLWQYLNGGISPSAPYTNVADFYIGGNSTASAKFGLINVNSGTPTASVSAGTSGATFLTANGNISTTARQNLTLGNSSTYNTTGNILLNPNGTGNVGIGTTSPAALLDVAGAGLINSLTLDANSGTALNISGAFFATDIDLQNSETIDNDTNNTINIGYGAANGIFKLTSATEAFLTSSVALNIDSATTNTLKIGAGANAKTITLGNTTGATALNLNSGTGDITLTSTDLIYFKPTNGVTHFNSTSSDNRAQFWNSAGTASMMIGYNGSPRIETSSANFYINYDADSHVYLFGGAASGDNRNLYVYGYDTGASAQKYGLFNVDTAGDFNIEAVSGEAIRLRTGGADVLTIDSGGNVGIGSTSPAATFQTVGSGAKTGSFTAARIDNSATTTTNAIDKIGLYINSTGTWDGSSDNSNNYGLYINVADGSPSRDWGIYTTGADKNYLSGTLEVGGFSTANTERLCWDGAGTSLITDCTGSPGDYAEEYGTTDASIHAGDIVVVDPTRESTEVITDGELGSKAWVVKSTSNYQSSVVGIISTNPNETIGQNYSAEENPRPVAISGRIPVKVSTINGPIAPGDLITTSTIPGVGMKATNKGQVVARALQSYTETNPNAVGKIVAQLSVSWYDGSEPDYISLEEFVNLQVTGTNATTYQVTNIATATPITTHYAAFTQIITAIVEAGLTRTRDLIVTGQAQIADLSVSHLSIGSQTLRDYVISIVQQNQPTAPVIVEVTPTPSQILAVNTVTAETVTANNLNSNTLQVTNQTQLGSLMIDQNATVAGVLTTTELNASSARMAALEAGIAQMQEVRATTASFTDASVSGSLYANSISNLDEQLATSLQKPSLANILLNQVPDNTEDLVVLKKLINTAVTTASQAAQLDQQLADLGLSDDDIVLTGSAAFIDKYLKVNGIAYVTDALGVGNSLQVGTKVELTDSYLAFTAATTNEGDLPYFAIQPSGKGLLSLMAGLMTLDETGTVAIMGDVTVAGNVEVKGTLLSNLLQPTDYGSPFQVKVAGAASESGDIQQTRFEIVNDLGSPVATISAQGEASVSKLTVTSQDPAATTDQLQASPSGQLYLSTTQSTGKATLPANVTELIIRNDLITSTSLVYLTPLASTQNQVLYIKRLESDPAAFVVGIDQALPITVPFTWWIIN